MLPQLVIFFANVVMTLAVGKHGLDEHLTFATTHLRDALPLFAVALLVFNVLLKIAVFQNRKS